MLENEAKKQNITTEQYLDLYMDMKIGTNMDSVKKLYGLSDNQINVMRGQLYSSSKETMEGACSEKQATFCHYSAIGRLIVQSSKH